MRYYAGRDAERKPALALPFRMVIDDIFIIVGRGVTVAGRVESGTLTKDDAVIVAGEGRSICVPRITFSLKSILEPGYKVDILLYDVQRDEVEIGMVITKRDT
jgi:translation elongation factor EF-Tu-like GTPase